MFIRLHPAIWLPRWHSNESSSAWCRQYKQASSLLHLLYILLRAIRESLLLCGLSSSLLHRRRFKPLPPLRSLPSSTRLAFDDMMKEPAASTSMADESNPLEIAKRGDYGFWHHKQAVFYCTITCLGAFQLGLDLGAIAGMQAMPAFLQVFGYADSTSLLGYNISPTVQQLISSLMSLGSFISCMAAGPVGHYLSRKWGLGVAVVLNHVSVIMMMVTTDISTLYAARFIGGLANGFFDVYPQLYIHESASPVQRASLLGWYNVLVSFGMLIGSIVDNYTAVIASKAAYQIPLGIFFIFPTILAPLLFFIPESPRWLAEHGKIDEARKSLVSLRSSRSSPQEIDAELLEITQALERERAQIKQAALIDLFTGINLRRTLVSIALMVCLAATGSSFLLSYGTYFFTMAGESAAFEEVVGITAGGLFGTLLSLYIVTKVGRRTILLTGTIVQCGTMLIIAVVYTTHAGSLAAGKCLVAFVTIYIFFYNMCTPSYLYLVAGEVPTQRLRDYTLGIALAIGFFGNWLINYTAPYFINTADLNWGPKYGYIWFVSNIVIFIFIFFFVPETRDRTLEEIDEMFEARLSARKFKNHVCIEANNARAAGLHLNDNQATESVDEKGFLPSGSDAQQET